MRQRALDIHPSIRRRPARAALSATAAAALAAGLALTGAGAAQAAPVTIDIVDINDFHGRIVRSASAPAAGAAYLADYVKDVKAQNPNTLFVSGGDNIGASTFESAVQNDEPTIEVLNRMGLVASAVGNHEFDRGFADLDGRVDALAGFPYLGANVFETATGQNALDPFHIETIGGVRVAFIGAVTEQMPSLVSPSGIAGLEFRDIVTSVNDVADALQDGNPANEEADVVIALIHEGPESADIEDSRDDSVFGEIATGLNPNVDAIFSGHTHFQFDHVVNGRPVIQAGQYGEAVARLTMTFDAATGAVTFPQSEVTPLTVDLDPNRTDSVVNWQPIPGITADPDVDPIVQEAIAKADVLGREEIGTITGDFNRAAQASAVNGSTENRGGESTLNNFIADVQLQATKELETEVAFMNPGGLRADLKLRSSGSANDIDGRVTYREAATVQPFANTLVTLDMTGAQIKQVLEEQWQRLPDPTRTPSRPFLKLGVSKSLHYVYDPTAARDQHITQMTLNGAPLADDQVVKVVTNSFLASGGDNFRAFLAGTSKADSGRVDLASLVDYFDQQEGPVAPDYDQRAVGAHIVAPSDGTIDAGDTLRVDLSSLLFSTGEPKSTTVEARIGGVLVGAAAIDPTIVNQTDEVGRAGVDVAIPASATPGSYDIVFTTTGQASVTTTFSLPITVTRALPGGGGTDPGAEPGAGSGSGSGTTGGTGGSAPAGSSAGTQGGLADTGFDATSLIGPSVAGALLMLLGAGLLMARRTRVGSAPKA